MIDIEKVEAAAREVEKYNFRTCNQCDEKMEIGICTFDDSGEHYNRGIRLAWYKGREEVMVCTNPECPSYGLLQIPSEAMPQE